MLSEIMSKEIIYGYIDSSIKCIAKLMKENNIGFIPIKDKDKWIGVITDRDICLACCSIKNTDESIKSYVSKNLICIDINSNIENALELMSKEKIKRLLVKDKDNIVGVLSLSDILEYTDKSNVLTTIKTIFYIHNNGNLESAEIDEFYL